MVKGRTILLCAAALLLAASPSTGFAQLAGFRVGVAPQPQFGFPPAAPAIMAPPFAVARPAPLIPRIPAVIGPQPVVIAPQFPLFAAPTFPTIIIPNHVLLPGQTIVAPPTVVNPPTTVFFPANPIQPSPPFVPRVNEIFPVIGMPRAEVIRQFGPPSVTVVTSTGETLFFPGGATIILHDGRVAGSKRHR